MLSPDDRNVTSIPANRKSLLILGSPRSPHQAISRIIITTRRLAENPSVGRMPLRERTARYSFMQKTIEYFSPDLDQFMGLAALSFVCLCLMIVGGAMSARKRLYELDIIAGWSLVSLSYVIAGGLIGLDFRIITGALLIALAVSAYTQLKRPRPIASSDMGRALILALPVVWLAACMTLSQWDEFTHWMPNARYLLENHTLPGEGNPPPSSQLPGYPYGLAYVVYLSSSLVGFLTENATPVFNIILLASLSVLVGRLIREAMLRAPSGQPKPSLNIREGNIGWLYCAIGILAVTALNPTFVPKIVFTSYADTPTAVLVGALCAILWLLLSRLAGENTHSAQSLAWSYGLVAMAAVSVKQPNVVLFGLVTIGGLLVALRDPNISFVRFFRLLPAMAIPPITMYIAWRLHISVNGVTGEVNFLPQADWLTDQISVVVGRMALIASKKGGYFAVMIVACLLAARAVWHVRSPLDRLSIIVAVLFVGYNVFLLFVYVTAFGGNGLVAPSYWRFNMQLGGACVIFAAYASATLWRNRVSLKPRRSYALIIFALIIVAPLALAHKIRFDQYAPKIFVRSVAEEIVETIPKGVRFASFDVTSVGDFEVIARYVIKPHVDYVGFMIAASLPTTENIREFVTVHQPQYAWINVPTESLQTVTGLTLPPKHSYLLKLENARWEIIKSWPFPGYDDPTTAPK